MDVKNLYRQFTAFFSLELIIIGKYDVECFIWDCGLICLKYEAHFPPTQF